MGVKGIRTLPAALLAAACAVTALPALAASLDQSSTATFIHDARNYIGSVIASEGTVRRAGGRFVASIDSGCPRLLPVSASNPPPASVALALEAGYELVLAEIAPVTPRTLAFNAEIARLPWDSARIERTLAVVSSEELALARLPRPPSLCTDIRAAAASAFTVVPRETTRFLSRLSEVLGRSRSTLSLPEFLAVLQPSVTAAEARSFATLKRLARATDAALNKITFEQANVLGTVLGAAPYP